MAALNDVPGPAGTKALTAPGTDSYQTLEGQRSIMAHDNALAYKNKLVRLGDKEAKLRRVLKSATFIPANVNRFTSGLKKENIKHFVVHRASNDEKSARLDNIIQTFAAPTSSKDVASTHFIIGLNGALIQMVDLGDKAYHVGLPAYVPQHPVTNSNSVGVELEGAVGSAFEAAQLSTLAKLLRSITRYCGATFVRGDKSVQTLWMHSEIWPLKSYRAGQGLEGKTDPGENFNCDAMIKAYEATASLPEDQLFQDPIDFSQTTTLEKVLADSVTFFALPHSQRSAARMRAVMSQVSGYQRAIELANLSRSSTNTAGSSFMTNVDNLILALSQHNLRLFNTMQPVEPTQPSMANASKMYVDFSPSEVPS